MNKTSSHKLHIHDVHYMLTVCEKKWEYEAIQACYESNKLKNNDVKKSNTVYKSPMN